MTKEIQACGTMFTVYADGPKRGVTIAPVNKLQFAKVMKKNYRQGINK